MMRAQIGDSTMDINWTVTFVLSVMGSIILSVVGNLLTRPIEELLDRIAGGSRERRIESLRAELAYIMELNEHKENLYVQSAIVVFSVLLLFIFSVILFLIGSASWFTNVYRIVSLVYSDMRVFHGADEIYYLFYPFMLYYIPSNLLSYLSIFTYILSIIGLNICLVICLNHSRLLNKVNNFETYKKRIDDRIAKMTPDSR